MRKISLSLLSAILLFASCQKTDKAITEAIGNESPAETGRKCASQEVLEEQLKTDLRRAVFLEDLERKTEAFKGRDGSQFRAPGKLYVPVAITVVLPNASQVTDAQIQYGAH